MGKEEVAAKAPIRSPILGAAVAFLAGFVVISGLIVALYLLIQVLAFLIHALVS